MAEFTVGQAVTWINPDFGKQTGAIRRIGMARANDGSEVPYYIVENDRFVASKFDYELTPVVSEPIAKSFDIERAVNEQKMRGYLESEYSQRQQYVDEMRESNRCLWYPARLIGLNGGKWYQKCYQVLP